MRKILFQVILFAFIATSLFAQTADRPEKPTSGTLLLAQGFAFQDKEFKTIFLAIINDQKSKQISKKTDAENDQQLTGKLAIGGFAYKLQIVTSEKDSYTADLFCRPEDSPMSSDKAAKTSTELEAPVGHISIKLNQPNPGTFVWLGTLRLTDEKVESVSGTFDIYMHDITPIPTENSEVKPTGEHQKSDR